MSSCPSLIQRLLARCSVYIVSSVYEARFKLFTLAFTFLTPLRFTVVTNAPRGLSATTLDVLLH